jgi:tyrosine-specific transport protein
MNKKTGAILLIAGTCIGSGMIALPMVLAAVGLIPSILFMLFIWGVMYFTSLFSLELNLQAGRGLSLGELGKRFSGKGAEALGVLLLKFLSYALLAVFLYAGTSVLQKLLAQEGTTTTLVSCYALGAGFVLMLPITVLDYVNRVLFIALLAVVAVLVGGLVSMMSWENLPLFGPHVEHLASWRVLIPVVFTSFGFQVIFHTLTNYCNKDARLLKSAFFWGSLIPAIVYIVWTCSVMGVIYHKVPDFYAQMALGKVDVGDLVKELSYLAQWPAVQILVWWISLLAIVTSVLGVGVGLCESLQEMMAKSVDSPFVRRFLAVTMTLLPAYLMVVFIPNIFLGMLGFAGMVLAVIAILMPAYLLRQGRFTTWFYPALRRTPLIAVCALIGVMIMVCELFNMMK